MPKLFIKVISIDLFDNQETVGYGHYQLALKAGTKTITINTFKIKPDYRIQSDMYFVGGSLELDPAELHERFNNYGIQTESSGQVTLEFSQILQQATKETKMTGKRVL
jgi:hypothetical protein